MKLKLIYWKASTLILSWAILGVSLMLMRRYQIDPPTFGNICIASAGFMIATIALLKPFWK